jgi:hypothetical protein
MVRWRSVSVVSRGAPVLSPVSLLSLMVPNVALDPSIIKHVFDACRFGCRRTKFVGTPGYRLQQFDHMFY